MKTGPENMGEELKDSRHRYNEVVYGRVYSESWGEAIVETMPLKEGTRHRIGLLLTGSSQIKS